MKRIIYLSLLLVIPFLLKADGYDRQLLNGKWFNPDNGDRIRLKVKRSSIRVKNLTRRDWVKFRKVGRRKFMDRAGNTIKLKNRHKLVFRSACGNRRHVFFKKNSYHQGHTCGQGCGFDQGNHGTSYYSHTDYGDDYGGYYSDRNYGNDRQSEYYNSWSYDERDARNDLSGQYYVREIDETVVIRMTNTGLKAKRNGKWVQYNQNRYRKNEYKDLRGNTYHVRNDRSLVWRSRNGDVKLNLRKR